MATLVGVGQSQQKNSIAALGEAYYKAIEPLLGNAPSLMLLFASSTLYDQSHLLSELKKKAPLSVLVGCSSAGEISSSGSYDNSLVLMALYSDQIQFSAGLGNNISHDSREAGRAMARTLLTHTGEKPQAALMFPDGITGNGADIIKGVLDIFGNDFHLTGGSAGDDFQFKKTYQYYNDQLLSDAVVGVGLYGNFSFGVGVRHGWLPIGTPRVATKSVGNSLYELDGKPAITFYEEQFDRKDVINTTETLARLAVSYPLGISAPNKDGYLIRVPMSVDKNGTITTAGEIPEGSEVFLMIGSTEEAIEAAVDAARQAVAQVAGKSIKAAILYNSVARKKLLMQKRQEEIKKIHEIIGEEVPLIGFYTYGEQAPLGEDVLTSSFHNETVVLFLIAL